MCGIIGVVVRDKDEMSVVKNLFRIWRNQCKRGNEGAGVSILSGGKLKRVRDVCPSALFSIMYYNFWKKLRVGDCVIFHHRLPTSGGKGDVINANHPFSNENGDIHLIHNGIINNRDVLYEKLIKYGHKFESVVDRGTKFEDYTDSEILVHMLENNSDMKKGIEFMSKKVFGTLAMAFMKEGEDKIWLYRINNPIKIFKDRVGNIYFASEKPKKGFKTISNVDPNIIYNISEEGIVRIKKKSGGKKNKGWKDIKNYDDEDWDDFDNFVMGGGKRGKW